MYKTRKLALPFAVAVLFMILCIQAVMPVRAEAKAAKLFPDGRKVTLKYSSHINSRYFYDAHYSISDLIDNIKTKATYTAVVKNTKVAKVIKNTDPVLTGDRFFLATGTGTTKAVVYEKLKNAKKKRKLGTVTIKVKEAKMAEVVEDAV